MALKISGTEAHHSFPRFALSNCFKVSRRDKGMVRMVQHAANTSRKLHKFVRLSSEEDYDEAACKTSLVNTFLGCQATRLSIACTLLITSLLEFGLMRLFRKIFTCLAQSVAPKGNSLNTVNFRQRLPHGRQQAQASSNRSLSSRHLRTPSFLCGLTEHNAPPQSLAKRIALHPTAAERGWTSSDQSSSRTQPSSLQALLHRPTKICVSGA